MKYKDKNYCQIWNNAIEKLNKTNHKIPYSARWLYIHLNFLEHRYSGMNEDYFFRSIKDLQEDTQIGRKQIINGIKILKELKRLFSRYQQNNGEGEEHYDNCNNG